MDAIPFAAFLLSVVGSTLFVQVGRTVQRRQVSREARSAQAAFVTFWYGLAAVTLVGAVQSIPGFPTNLTLYMVLLVVLLVVLCAALAGLMHYLIFLYTSRRNVLPFIAVGYALYFVVLLAYILQSEPTGIEATRWGQEVQFANTIDSGPLYWTVVILLIVPPIVSAAAYLSLYRLVQDPVLKRRILLVSLSIIVWFGSSLVGTAFGAEDSDGWRLASRLISMGAAATVLYAYAGLRPSTPQGVDARGAPAEESIYEEDPRRGVSSVLPLA